MPPADKLTSSNSRPDDQGSLRTKAEAELAHSPLKKMMPRPAEELLHELQVHQIELEMQNETLRQSLIALEESRDRYVDFYDFAPSGYITFSRDALITEINLTGAKLLGKERSKLLNRRFARFVAPEDTDIWHRHFMEALKQGTKLTCELSLLRGDGSRLYVQLDSMRVEQDNKIPMVRTTLSDITARRSMEDALQQSEQRRHLLEQQEIIQTSLDGFWVVNANNGQILEVNDRFCNMVGYSQEEILSMNINDLDAIETPEETEARVKRIREVGYDRFETRHRHKQGHLIDFEVSVTHSDVNGGINFAFFRDITERKQAEETVRSSKAKLDAALASMNDAVFISNTEGRILEFNDAFVKFHKFRNKEECSKTLSEYPEFLDVYSTGGELLPLEQWTVPRALRGEAASNAEFTLRRRDTGETWVGSYSYAPIFDNNGVIVGSVVAGRDVTERNRILEALKISEENYRNLFENSRDAMVTAMAVPPLRFMSANHSAMLMFGANSETELIGMRPWELSPEQQPDGLESALKARQMIEVAIRNGSHSFEWTHKRLNGEVFQAEILLTLLKLNGLDCIQASIRDITDRKRAEDIVRQSRDQLKTFIEQAPISIAMFDRDMNYLAVSGRWMEIYGRGYANLIGLNHDVVLPDMPAKWKIAYQQALAGVALQDSEDMWIQSDGSRHWLRWAVHPWIDENKNIGGIIIYTEDITDTKLLEMEITERRNEMDNLQKMHVAAQTASAIAHEINQPLLAIATYSKAGLMMMNATKPDYDEVSNALERTEQQALRAGKSIRDLINFLSRKEFPTEPFDLNQEIIGIVGTAKSEHNLVFHSILKLDEELPLVRANRTHVQKVLLNLLRNGIDAMEAAGVPLPAITVTICTTKDKSCAQMTIQDNGPGIKKEDINRVFEPFFTTKAKGIGMGLAISRSLIEENGGRLWVDPQEGQSATFHLTLPFAT